MGGDFDPFGNGDGAFFDSSSSNGNGNNINGNADNFGGGGGDGDMSKFESFMKRNQSSSRSSHSRLANNGRMARNGNAYGNPNNLNPLSPESQDGMSMVSRMKHDNYANVVLEMKRKQNDNGVSKSNNGNGGGNTFGGGGAASGRQQRHLMQQQQQQQQQQDWGFDASFGNADNAFAARHADTNGNNNFPMQMQQQQPHQQQPQWGYQSRAPQRNGSGRLAPPQRDNQHQNNKFHRQQQQGYGSGGNGNKYNNPHPSPMNYNAASNNAASSASPQQQQQQQSQQPPTRMGRRLYVPQSDTDARQTRSRSTVRRNADRTKQLGSFVNRNNNGGRHRRDSSGGGGGGGGDNDSDVGSVYSIGGDSVFGGIMNGLLNNNSSLNNSGSGLSGGGSHRQGWNNLGSGDGNSRSLSGSGEFGSDGFDEGGTVGGSGSFGNAGHDSPWRQQRRGNSGGGTAAAGGRNSLDSLLSSRRSNDDDNANDNDGDNVSVAARRRARSRLSAGGGTPTAVLNGSAGVVAKTPPRATVRSSPSQQRRISSASSVGSNVSIGSGGGGNGNSNGGSSAARSRMRMRMQGKQVAGATPSPLSSTLHQQQRATHSPPRPPVGGAGNNFNGNTTGPLRQQPPSWETMDDSMTQIDQEVNMALSELRITHPDLGMDFEFGRVDSVNSSFGGGNSSVNSASTLGSGSHQFAGINATGGSSGNNSSFPSPAANKSYTSSSHAPVKPPPASSASQFGARNSPLGGGRTSPHTVSTKSVTLEGSNATSSASAAQRQHQQNTNSISPVISVDQHSESSSLTDDVNSGKNVQGGSARNVGPKTNMFKDAERMGSTFHKSKKIVRPGEQQQQQQQSATMTTRNAATPPVHPSSASKSSIPEQGAIGDGEDDNNDAEGPTSPSVRDRISKFGEVSTPRQSGSSFDGGSKFAQRLEKGQQRGGTREPTNTLLSPSNDSVVSSSSVRNSPFRRSDAASASSPGLPPKKTNNPSSLPPLGTSSPGGIGGAANNPFGAVKLRKTRPASTPSRDDESYDKETIDSSAANALARGRDEEGTAEGTSTPSNPFLSQVKLRKTDVSLVASRVSREKETREESTANLSRYDDEVAATASSRSDGRDEIVDGTPERAADERHDEAPRRKLTWREQQEARARAAAEEAEGEQRPPQKDVATLIRERIAANKQQGAVVGGSSNVATNDSGGGAASWRDGLKKTSTNSAAEPAKYEVNQGLTKREDFDNNIQLQENGGKNVEEEEKDEADDPRAALMAMISQRAAPQAQSPPKAKEAEKERATAEEEVDVDPRSALMTMIAKRKKDSEQPQQKDEKDDAAKSALSSMLAKRGGGGGGVASPEPSRDGAKNALSDMLANRGGASPSTTKGSADENGRPALKNDPKYEKYFKMLKVGMPLPAVQHAMTRDGLDPTVMDGDHNLPAPEPQPSPKGGVPLKQDPAYAKYFKMLKLGLPMGAVKNAMERDGVDPEIMDLDHNAPLPSSFGGGGAKMTSKREKDTHRRTRLHWDTSGVQVNSNSVWALMEDDKELEHMCDNIDEQEFTTLFQAEIKSAISGGAKPEGPQAKKSVVQVIDPKRANNGGIILARLRMSYDDLAKAVDKIDETAMTANQAQGIIEYMPTLSERKALRDYMRGSEENSAFKFERLCECEKFMVAMMTVTQSKRKIRALLFKLQFRGCIHDLAHDVFAMEKACDELINSVRLRKLFGIVLNIGNRLNTAGPGQKRKAGAFTIKSLLKLNQAKAFDNKTTFLHYVALVVKRNNEALLDFKEDLPTVPKADKIYWDQCVSELEEVETQLENVRKLALHEAKSNKIVYKLPNKAKESEDHDSDDLSVESMSLEEEVGLLRSTKIGMFALSAIRKVSQLRERVDTAKDKFAGLLEYFGESQDSKMQPHELFEIITTFCRNFDAARAEVDEMEKTKKRNENKKEREANKVRAKNEKLKSIQEHHPPPVKKRNSAPLPRASALQPSMTTVLSDLKRATSHKKLQSPANNKAAGSWKYPADESTCSDGNSHEDEFASTGQSSESIAHAEAMEESTRKQAEAEAFEAEERRAKEADERRLAEEEAARIAKEKAAAAEAAAREEEKEHQRAEAASTAESAASLQEQRNASEVVPTNSKETEVDGPAGRSNVKTQSPQKTRREIISARRERARNRHFRQTSSPTKAVQQAATVTSPPVAAVASAQGIEVGLAEPHKEEPKQQAAVSKPATISASARASARDRYARHKKMLHQRHGAT